jgi:phosphoadenosine phosphosulfate reductase
VNEVSRSLASTIGKHKGRALFSTRFSLEDQVLAHLIFKSKLPIRVFTFSGADQYDILIRSVEFFKANIEISFQQARLAAASFAERHPEVVSEYEDSPSTAPLSHLLLGNHLLISSRRKDQLLAMDINPIQFEWDKNSKRAIFYPLFDWTAEQVQAYIEQAGIPHIGGAIQRTAKGAEAPSEALPFWDTFLRWITPRRQSSTAKNAGHITTEWYRAESHKQAVFGLLE